MIDAFAAPDARENLRFLVEPLGWDQDGDRLADDFLGRIAEDALGSAIPVSMMPSMFLLTMASSEHSTMAASF